MYALAHTPHLALAPWRALTLALSRTFHAVNSRRIVICGIWGEGVPLLDDCTIGFNGNLLGRHHWATQHTGRMIPGLEYDDAHEQFELHRCTAPTSGRFAHLQLNTGGKPYTLAVRTALLYARHFYPADTLIETAPGGVADWADALDLGQLFVADLQLPPECRIGIVLRDTPASVLNYRPLRGGR